MPTERPRWATWPQVPVPMWLRDDPETQNVTFINGFDGSKISLSLGYLDAFQLQYASAANFGIQLGMNLIVLLIVLLITPRNKLKLPVCLVNMAAIVCGVLREVSIITALSKSQFFRTYAQMTFAAGDMDMRFFDHGSKAGLYLTQIFALLVAYLVEILLFLHARVILSTLSRKYWISTMTFLGTGSLACLGLRTMWAVSSINDLRNLRLSQYAPSNFSPKMQKAAGALIAESVAAYSIVFTGRIFLLLYRRHKMGVQKAKPLQILIFISLESMILPIILVAFQWAPQQPWVDPQTWMFTSVAILMPFGSIWSSQLKYRKEVGVENLPDGRPDIIKDQKSSELSHSFAQTFSNSSKTYAHGDVRLPQYSVTISSPPRSRKTTSYRLPKSSPDLEKGDEKNGTGITVTHDLSLTSFRGRPSESTLAFSSPKGA